MGEPRLRMQGEEYLAFERSAPGKHELWDGEVYAMSGASLVHNRLVANLVRHLGIALEGSECIALPSDMRVRIPQGERYVYPDVTIVCGPPTLEGEADVLLNPHTVVEVLSPSSATRASPTTHGCCESMGIAQRFRSDPSGLGWSCRGSTTASSDRVAPEPVGS